MINQVVEDIKALKIQGAENIAISAVEALKDLIYKDDSSDIRQLQKKINDAKTRLILARVTEPCLRNAVNYCTKDIEKFKKMPEVVKEMSSRIEFTLNHFKISRLKITEYGANSIMNGSVVYTHCHSSTVVEILIAAKKKGVDFKVYNTETRPLFQGRKTAKELSEAGIDVTHYVDSAARIALKKADIALFGCDAITTDKIVNKIGSELFLHVARDFDVSSFVCTNSWKFDALSIHGVPELIEERDPKEVWTDAPKKVKVVNYAFEKIDPDKISGIISELGVYPHQTFIGEVKKNYPYLL